MINKIDIFGLRNGSTKKVATIPCDNSFHNTSMMAKDELSVSVVTDKPLNLVVGDYITIGDTSYRMNRDAEFTQKSEVQHEYSIIFEHPIYTLLDKVLCNRITGSTKVVLTGKLRDFLELLVWNVNRSESNPLGVDTGWEIGLCPDTEYKNIVLDGISCRAALDELRKAFNVEYYASNKTINFVSHIENETGLTFTQGRGKGLYSLEQKNVDSSDVVTRLFPKGGTENVIPGEGDEDGRLVLPEKYIEDFSETSKVVERVVVFDGIHPTFQGKVGALSGENNKSFICNEIDFDIKEFAVGSDARVNFLTGDLLGKAFEFSWDNSKKKITLIGQVDELALIDPSTQSRPVIPDANKYLRGGELFTLTGLRMSGTYKENAISTLREKGREWLKYHCRKRVKYNLDVDYRMLRGKRTLSVGDLVTIKDKNRGINALIRIVSVERNLRTGKLSCVVSNYLDEKWEKRIEGQIASVQTAISGGGYSSGNVDIIEKNDAREFTDSRILSSLRTIKEIIERSLSRQGDDTAEGLITFLKGLTSESKITSKDFIEALKGIHIGENGSGVEVLQDGTTQAVVDRLYVKVKAYFETLEIRKKTHVGGEQILSPAGMKCIRVEEHDGYYRCFFLARQDGIEIHNEFTPGTLAISKEDNINEGASSGATNRYYWRKVVSVGRDYIDLSKTHCDQDSDAPAAGDDIVGLGHETDIARQGAIVLSSVSEKAPSITFYAGINSYSLLHKEIIELGYDKVTGKPYQRIYGDFYAGARDKSTYMEYTPEKGVVIRGIVNIGDGSTGASNLTDLPQEVEKIIPPVWDIYAVNVIEGAPVDVNTNQKLAELGDGAVDLRAKFVRNGQDVTEVMKRSTLRLYEFKRINPLGHDDNNLSDEDWYEANKGKDVYRLTPGDVMWACNLVAVFDEDILENEYKKLK